MFSPINLTGRHELARTGSSVKTNSNVLLMSQFVPFPSVQNYKVQMTTYKVYIDAAKY